MPGDAYFSFGDEEPVGQPAAAASDPRLGAPEAVGVADPIFGEGSGDHEGHSGRPRPLGDRRGESRGGLRDYLTPPRLAALAALVLAVFLIAHVVAGALVGGSSVPQGAARSHAAASAGQARAVAPSHAGIATVRRDRRRPQEAERERVERRRSQTRPRARRHRQRRPNGRRDLVAPRVRRAPEPSRSSEPPESTQPSDPPEPPPAGESEVPTEAYVPPTSTPPTTEEAPVEPAPEPAPERPRTPHIRDGAHSAEFGL